MVQKSFGQTMILMNTHVWGDEHCTHQQSPAPTLTETIILYQGIVYDAMTLFKKSVLSVSRPGADSHLSPGADSPLHRHNFAAIGICKLLFKLLA